MSKGLVQKCLGERGYTPGTGEFRQANGIIEMVFHVGDQKFRYLNDGTQFKLQQ